MISKNHFLFGLLVVSCLSIVVTFGVKPVNDCFARHRSRIVSCGKKQGACGGSSSGHSSNAVDTSSKARDFFGAAARRDASGGRLGEEICYVDPWGTIYYCPDDTICCTYTAKLLNCCPADHPVCMPDNIHCCDKEHSARVCGKYCCKDGGKCCGDGCHCREDAVCCQEKQCCNKKYGTCCDCEGCGGCLQCASAFDVTPCKALPPDTFHVFVAKQRLLAICPTPGYEDGNIFRVLRSDESCKEGLIARRPLDKTVSIVKHVGCGKNISYRTPYISFTSSLAIARFWAAKGGYRVAKVQLNSSVVKDYCFVTDLTNDAYRQMVFGDNYWARGVAENSCEVVLRCGNTRLPCSLTLEGNTPKLPP